MKMKAFSPNICKHQMKVIFVGESTVGKTSLITKLSGGDFMEHTVLSSTPMEFFNTTKVINGTEIKAKVWDTAGQEKFRSVNKIYYKDAKIAFIVYDVTDRRTFDAVKEYWIKNVMEIIGNSAGKEVYIQH